MDHTSLQTPTEEKEAKVLPFNPPGTVETNIQVASEEELEFLKGKKEAYVTQGVHEVEAMQLAAADWNKLSEDREAFAEKTWDEITKKVGMAEFVDDQIRRALGLYKTAWQKTHEGQTIDFKMRLDTKKSQKSGMIAGASLKLEVSVNGVWTVWRNKEITFQHIREMREGHVWKLKLYEALFCDLVGWGVSYALVMQETKDEIAKNKSNGRDTGDSATVS